MTFNDMVEFCYRHPERTYTEKQLLRWVSANTVSTFNRWRYAMYKMYGLQLKKIRGEERYKIIEHPVESLVKMYFFKFVSSSYSGVTIEWEFKMGLRRTQCTPDFMEDLLMSYIGQVKEFQDELNEGVKFTVGIQLTGKVVPENSMTEDVIWRAYDISRDRLSVMVKPNLLFDIDTVRLPSTIISPFYTISIDIDNPKEQNPVRNVYPVRRFLRTYRRKNIRWDLSNGKIKKVRTSKEHIIIVVDKMAINRFRSHNIAILNSSMTARLRSREYMSDDPMRVRIDSHRTSRDRFFDYSKGVLFDLKWTDGEYSQKDFRWHRVK